MKLFDLALFAMVGESKSGSNRRYTTTRDRSNSESVSQRRGPRTDRTDFTSPE
jgi:hypothetical protein